MSLCTQGQCTAPPPLGKLPINQAGRPKRGEIFTVCAAMKHPVLDHVKQSGATAFTRQSTFQDARSRCSKGGFKDGAKPCIISQPATPKQNERIYLIRIFDPATLSEIPPLLRHYLVPMHSVSNTSSPSQYGAFQEHLHTNPSWAEGSRHWVFAFDCAAEDGALSAQRHRRRPTIDLPDGSHYNIDLATMREFDFLCAIKAKEWASKPRDEQKREAKKLETWKPKPTRNRKKFIQDESMPANGKGAGPDMLATELLNFEQNKPKRSAKLGDTASMMSTATSMPLGGIRVREFFRHVIRGGGGRK